MPDYKQLMRQKAYVRKEMSGKGRSRYFLKAIFLTVMFTGLIFAGAIGSRILLGQLPIFKIKELSITNMEGEPLPNARDYFSLDLVGELNLFSFDMQRAILDIQARHPQLAAVSIRKQFPHKLAIVLAEREPVAIIVAADPYLVDAEGFILPYKYTAQDLPKIRGIPPEQIQPYSRSKSLRLKFALNLLEKLKDAGIYPQYKLSQIDLRVYSEPFFYLEDTIEVKIGKDELDRKIALLSEILAQLKANAETPQYIDMRFGDPVVKP